MAERIATSLKLIPLCDEDARIFIDVSTDSKYQKSKSYLKGLQRRIYDCKNCELSNYPIKGIVKTTCYAEFLDLAKPTTTPTHQDIKEFTLG
jgi:hypothetical protein